MADGADRAEELEQQARDIALQNMQQRSNNFTLKKQPDGHYHCEECGDVMPDLRVEKINATRCVYCQTLLEKQQGIV